MNKNSKLWIVLKGMIVENPVLVLVLGTCPALAVSNSIVSSIILGIAATIILICSNVVISLLRKIIPSKIRIAAYIVVIAGFVTIVDLLMQAFLPSLSESLGVFIPLIVVNCIILARAESFASKNSVAASAIDGLAQGVGYTIVLVLMCIIREFFGNGTFGGGILGIEGAGIRILPTEYTTLFIILPFGGFLVMGVLIAAMQHISNKADEKRKEEK